MKTNNLASYDDFYNQRMEEIEAEQLAKGEEFRPNKYRQRPAREWVRMYLTKDNNIEKIPYEIREALSVLFLETVRERQQKSKGNQFLRLFGYEGESLSGVDVYKETKLGVGECKAIINKRLATASPEKRMWISVSEDVDVVYTLEAVGPVAPEGWVGYMPNDKIEL